RTTRAPSGPCPILVHRQAALGRAPRFPPALNQYWSSRFAPRARLPDTNLYRQARREFFRDPKCQCDYPCVKHTCIDKHTGSGNFTPRLPPWRGKFPKTYRLVVPISYGDFNWCSTKEKVATVIKKSIFRSTRTGVVV